MNLATNVLIKVYLLNLLSQATKIEHFGNPKIIIKLENVHSIIVFLGGVIKEKDLFRVSQYCCLSMEYNYGMRKEGFSYRMKKKM